MPKEFNIQSLTPDMLTDMYLTFLDSFSDYEVPFKLSKKQFVNKFVMKLKIDFDTSVGVWDDRQGMVAFIFTSLAQYQSKATAYNGGTGVRPSARGNDLVVRMYDFLLPHFNSQGIEQCILEVLIQNEKAIRAYEKVGFVKTNLFKCYKLSGSKFLGMRSSNLQFRFGSTPQLELYQTFVDGSASFLDTLLMAGDFEQEKIIEAYDQNKCIGYLIYQPAFSRINHLAVSPVYRRSGVATGLLNELIRNESPEHLTVLNVAEDAIALNSFFEEMGFENQLNQFEMRLDLI